MPQTKLHKLLLRHLSGRQWYRQRFDGSPLFLSVIGLSEPLREKRKPAGTEAEWRIAFFEDGKGDWFLDQADIDRGATVMLRLVRRQARVGKRLMAKWRPDENKFDRYFLDFTKIRLIDLSDEALAKEFTRYHALAVARFTSSAIIDHFALGTDELVANLLRKEIGQGKESDFSAVFAVATAPVHQSFINTAEVDLLRIAIVVQAGESLTSPKITQLLQRHQQKYFWTNNNYVDAHVLDVAHFHREIRSWLGTGKDLRHQMRLLQHAPQSNVTKKRALFSRYRFSTYLCRLLEVSEDFTHWQDERKRATYWSIHIGAQILQEMARRRKVDDELLKYCASPKEVLDWFMRGELTVGELRQRQKRSVVIWSRKKTEVYTGKDVQMIYDAMLPTKKQETGQDIRGLVACTGKAIGRARIVMSAKQIAKVEAGDILIAVMTRPDYVPAMKRAAAIVTNEGGITCHAAIVSRELGIPCIIGTKVATEMFKDGDLVEVNANHNWVRKVSTE